MNRFVKKNTDYRADIDGLRAISVILVILFHLDINFFSGGFVGVDVFFVISGFLITKLIRDSVQKNDFDFFMFYKRRFWRLAPALFVTVTASYLFATLVFTPQHFERLAGSSLTSVLGLSNIYFYHESGYFDLGSDIKPLLHTWSLGVEEQFYLIWPAIIVFFVSKYSNLGLAASVICVAILSFAANIFFVDNESAIFFLTPFRMFEFCIGASCVLLKSYELKSDFVKDILVMSGLSLIIVCAILYTENTTFPYYNALIPCFGAALIIYSNSNGFFGKFLKNNSLVYLGLVSYSLYLVHWPITVFYKYSITRDLMFFDKTLIFILSIILAIALYMYVELPFRNIKKLRDKTWVGFVSFIPLLGVISLSVITTNGWSWRLSEDSKVYAKQIIQNENEGCIETESFKDMLSNCAFGDYKGDEKFDVVLIGDSHSRSIRPGLHDYFVDEGISAVRVGQGATFPILDATLVDNKNKKYIYTDAYKEIYKKIIELKPKFVIIAARWDLAYNNSRPFSDSKRYIIYKNNGELSPESSRKAFEDSVRDTVDIFNSNNISVGIFSSIPYIGRSVPDCYVRNLISCDDGLLSANEVLNRNFEVNYYIDEMISENKNNKFFNITKYLCLYNEPHCIYVLDQVALFKDPHHFTKNGAESVINNFFISDLDDFFNKYQR